MCLTYLKFSDLLPETHIFFSFGLTGLAHSPSRDYLTFFNFTILMFNPMYMLETPKGVVWQNVKAQMILPSSTKKILFIQWSADHQPCQHTVYWATILAGRSMVARFWMFTGNQLRFPTRQHASSWPTCRVAKCAPYHFVQTVMTMIVLKFHKVWQDFSRIW